VLENVPDEVLHPAKPGRRPEPFRDRQEAVFRVFGSAEDDLLHVGFPGPEGLGREQEIVRQGIDARRQLLFGGQHLPHGFLQVRVVEDICGQHHERIVVGGRVLRVPVSVDGQVARDKAGAWVGVDEPALSEAPAELNGFLALGGVPPGPGPGLVLWRRGPDGGGADQGHQEGQRLFLHRDPLLRTGIWDGGQHTTGSSK
jgi:hypothetical protein